MDKNLMKRVISLLLCVVLLLGNFPVTVRAEEARPECNGSSDCSAESHAEGCEKAAADQAVADTVDAMVAELPALADIQTKPMEEAEEEYAQVNAAYDAYQALTDDQKALLAYGEELFTPYLQYFSGGTQEAIVSSGSCGENLTWSLDMATDTLTISGTGAMDNYASDSDTPWYSVETEISTIVIGDGIESIGAHVFSYCESLTNITIPDSITSIGEGAFLWCSSLTNITIPNGVTSIGLGAFSDCIGLTSISLPDSITSIANLVFANCKNLKSITIPDSVTAIGNYAFSSCASLSDVYFSGTETQWATISIGTNNSPLTTATKHYTDPCASGHSYGEDNICTECGAVDLLDSGMCGENLTWMLDKNGLLTISGTGAMADISVDSVPWKTWKSDIQFVVIEEGITNIPYGAFYECQNLKTVSIPASVNSVEDNFQGCNSLEAINVAADNLNYCSADGVLFTKDMTVLIKYPPNKPDMEYTVPDTVTALRIQSFMNSKNLVSIVLPDDITSLTLGIFSGCTALKDIKLPKNLKNIEGSDNFAYCTGLERIELPENLENTGIGTFRRCINLKEVVLPKNLKTIDGDVFQECVSLERLVVPENVTSMGMALFFTMWEGSSAALKEIVFQGNAPEFFATNDTFAGVTATAYYPAGTPTWTETVKQNYSGTINWKVYCPDDEHEFERVVDEKYLVTAATCTSVAVYKKSCLYCGLASTTETFNGNVLDSSNHYFVSGVCTRCNFTEEVISDLPEGLVYTIADGKVTITGYTGSATSLVIPAIIEGNPVTGIDANAFLSNKNLISVAIPEGVTSIGGSAFNSCTSLTEIIIPGSVTSIGKYAFTDCGNLEDVYFNGTENQWYNELRANKPQVDRVHIGYNCIDNHWVEDNKKGTCLELRYTREKCACGYIRNEVIEPAGHDFDAVSRVCTRCALPEGLIYEVNNGEVFIADYTGTATNLVIPAMIEEKSVTSIRDYAFYNCSSLTEVMIPEGVSSIGSGAFVDCSSLEEIAIPDSVTSIGSSAFSGCSSLKGITILDGVTAIGDFVFERCSSLEEITIPDSVTGIGSSAFYGCSSLEEITIPDSVTSIDSSAFYGCSSLKGITIPDGVTSIDGWTFYGCSSLEEIAILGSVASIESWTFYGCISLREVTIPESVTSIGSFAFGSCAALENVYYGGTAQQWEAISNRPYFRYKHYSCTDSKEHWREDTADATCTAVGYARETCDCGYIRNEVIKPATEEHVYNQKVVAERYLISAATCQSPAIYKKSCICGAASDTETFTGGGLDPDNHTGVNHTENAKNATCTEEGYTGDTVCECGETVSYGQAIKQEDHSYDSVVTPPTCTEKGYTTHTCVCGDSYVDTYVDALDHDMSEWATTKEPTTAAEGEKTRSCQRIGCDYMETEKLPKNQHTDGWVLEDGDWVFYENGVKVTDAWRKDSIGWCYLGSDGAMMTNCWLQDSKGWCYIGADGYCETNCWKQDSIGWLYLDSEGSMTKNTWVGNYYLNSEGYMETDVWVYDSGYWYYLGSDGAMVTNAWRKDSYGWCYLGADGAMVTNCWLQDSKGWCYIGADGYCETECWKEDSYGWLYLDEEGSMTKEEWVLTDGDWYYLDEEGYMVTGDYEIDGTWYSFNDSGVWVV